MKLTALSQWAAGPPNGWEANPPSSPRAELHHPVTHAHEAVLHHTAVDAAKAQTLPLSAVHEYGGVAAITAYKGRATVMGNVSDLDFCTADPEPRAGGHVLL